MTVQVSSAYHPHTGLGYCPNIELLQFMALATSGAYLQLAPRLDSPACWFKMTNMYPTTHLSRIAPSEPYLYDMNIYHEAFLAWSFRKCLDGVKVSQPHVASDKDLFR